MFDDISPSNSGRASGFGESFKILFRYVSESSSFLGPIVNTSVSQDRDEMFLNAEAFQDICITRLPTTYAHQTPLSLHPARNIHDSVQVFFCFGHAILKFEQTKPNVGHMVRNI
jgi:hypothetical protein